MNNESRKKVSIIIPTYNRREYICEAIESALNQTYKSTEIIIVDDGSTDGTAEIIRGFGNNVVYIYTDNGGPAHARNVGLKAACGEYIAFLDSDDLYYPYKCELQANILDKYPDAAMVSSEFSAFDDHGYWDLLHLQAYHKSAFKKNKLTYEDIYSDKHPAMEIAAKMPFEGEIYFGNIYETYLYNMIVFTNSMMFRRSILEVVGLQNPKLCAYAEDYEFALRICKMFPVAFVNLPTYKLRYHGDQISDKGGTRGIHVLIRQQRAILKIFEENAIEDEEYYSRNRRKVNARAAALKKAIAIPQMARGMEPTEARQHLEDCASYGHPQWFLWAVTFCPYLIRRIVIKVLSILNML